MKAEELFTAKRMAVALGVLLLIAFIGPATGMTSFFYRDFGVLGYPTAAYHREMFWRAELPLWNPYSNCGVPFLAQWGTMALYPFTLIYLVLPFPWSLNVFCLLHLWWGAVGAFALAKHWTRSSEGAALASVLFLFNGLTLSSLSWANYTVALAWAPWLIFFAEAAWREKGWSLARAAAVGTMQMLAGVPELTLLTWIFIGALWFPEMIKSGGLRRGGIVRALILIALIAALSAAQLLPFFQLLGLSHREAGTLATKWSIPPLGVANFILPMLHAFQTPQGTWFQHNQHFLSSTYLGSTAVFLAAFGAFAKDRRARILTIVSIACVLFAVFGFWQKLPLVGLARYPVKFVLLLVITIPALAAFGLKQIQDTREKPRIVFAAALLAACIALLFWARTHPYRYDRWPETLANSIGHLAVFIAAFLFLQGWTKQRKPIAFALLLFLLFADGRFHIKNQNPETRMATLSGPLDRTLPKLGEGRIFITPEAEERLLNSAVKDLDADFIGKRLAAWSHLNLVELTPKVNGSATLQIREQKQVQDWLYSGTNANQEAWLDFLGVTHITAPDKVVEWTNRSASSFSNQFAYRKAEPIKMEVHTIEVRAEKDRLKSTMDVVGIPQTWHPAWRAKLIRNGEVWPVQKVNHAFLGIVPNGEVRLYYRDDRFIAGLAISFLALGICFGLALPRRSATP